MWAVSPIPSSPSWPPFTITKQPFAYRPAPVTVSAKPRRQSRNRNEDLNYYDEDDNNEVGSSAQAIAKSDLSWELKSQEPDGSPSQGIGRLGRAVFTAANNSVNPKEEKQISGSDVLWATQKAATARKSKAKKKEVRSDSQVTKINGGNRKKRIEEVEPLDIRGDWGTRLDDLEKRLHELTDI